MSKFKKICLGDYIMVKHGFAFSGEFFTLNPSKYVLTTPGNFKIGGGFQELKNKYYTGPIDEEYILNKHDIIVTMTDLSKSGDTLGYSSLVPADNKYLHNQRIGRIYFKNDNMDKMFLYWLLRTPHYHNYVVSSATGSTVRHTAPKTIQAYECYVPETKEEQKAIADVLSSFDDKIELNNKIIKNLEEQAQSLYKHWFVDFEFPNKEGKPYKSSGGKFKESELGLIPEDWVIKKLGDFFPVITGKKNANIAEDDGIYPFFSCSQDILFCNNYSFDNSAILLAGNGDFSVKVYEGKFEAYQRTYVLIPNNKNLLGFLYYTIKLNLDKITSGFRGSVIKFITKGNIEDFKIAFNDDLIIFLVNFTNIVRTKAKILLENKKLEETRDYLLQKLMSGEIKVTDIK